MLYQNVKLHKYSFPDIYTAKHGDGHGAFFPFYKDIETGVDVHHTVSQENKPKHAGKSIPELIEIKAVSRSRSS